MNALQEINLISPINLLSYGYIGQNLAKAFIELGVKVNLTPIGPVQIDEKAGYLEYLERCNNTNNPEVPTIIVWHHNNLGEIKVPGKPRIGFPIFEVDTFSPEDIEQLNTVDQLFVCSVWAKEVLVQNGYKKKIDVVPLGYDEDIFKPNPRTPDGWVKFINIGKYEIRKGHPELIKTFGETFRHHNDVSLTLVCYNPFLEEENKLWANYAKKWIPEHQLNIFPGRLDSCVDVCQLINGHDVAVFPSRAEGWNLPLFESLILNKTCIATDYSAHTDFCNKNNSILIPVEEKEVCFDGKWFMGQGQWAKLDTAVLRDKLLLAYQNIKDGIDLHSRSSLEHLTWLNSARAIERAIR